ncbi:MAG: putative Cytoplasmic dynein 2 heavy chain 1 [Streblomastix strix]|uniref:Putative Cytoplasmic dynein 2 heavy chain 1 n=1 Tax=Streblomastix strix TaxID=222440 RepID=A0A5J4X803_9EUKA|nr:MAG: putative Cytoplasmic dynein 2 heavy chain 1 [Streblomastix strix]
MELGGTSSASQQVEKILDGISKATNAAKSFEEITPDFIMKIFDLLEEHCSASGRGDKKRILEAYLTRCSTIFLSAARGYLRSGSSSYAEASAALSGPGGRALRGFGQFDLLHSDYDYVRDTCELTAASVGNWLSKSRQQTELWTHAQGFWTGKPFESTECKVLLLRIEEIIELRATLHQLVLLLRDNTQLNDGIQDNEIPPELISIFDTLFIPFEDIDILNIDKENEENWLVAKSQYNQRLEPIELLVAQKLRFILGSRVNQKVQQTLREMQGYQFLLTRPSILSLLGGEREMVLKEITEEVDVIKQEFSTLSSTSPFEIMNEKSVQTKKRKGKDQDDEEQLTSHPLLSKNVPLTVHHVMKGIQEIQLRIGGEKVIEGQQDGSYSSQRNEQKGIKDQIKKSGQEGALKGRLLVIDEDTGMVRVEYNERYVSLLREIRHFSALGVEIPMEVKKIAATAAAVYRHAVQLKQIATFYNSIHTQVIPSQRAMLKDVVETFDEIVTNPFITTTTQSDKGNKGIRMGMREEKKEITWKHEADIEVYMVRLKAAADAVQILDRVRRLLKVPLQAQFTIWRSEIKEIESIIDRLQQRGLDTEYWRLHWHHQIYKVFRFQFILGLETLIENLAERRVEMVFDGQRAKLKPGIPEIRHSLYREVKRYMQTKITVGDMVDMSLAFDEITNQCSVEVGKIYMALERIVFKLELVQQKYENFVPPASQKVQNMTEQQEKNEKGDQLNILEKDEKSSQTSKEREQQLLINQYKQSNDWENALREAEKQGIVGKQLPNEEKVECFTVSLNPLRSAAEDEGTKLIKQILYALRSSLRIDSQSIIDMNNDIDNKIKQNDPKTLTEIQQSMELCTDLEKQIESKKQILSNATKKAEILQQHLKSNGIELIEDNKGIKSEDSDDKDKSKDETQNKELQVAFKAFERSKLIIVNKQKRNVQQRTILKNNVEQQRKQQKNKIDQFLNEWINSKVNLDLREDSSIQAARVICDRFQKRAQQLEQEQQQVVSECKAAGVAPPEGGDDLMMREYIMHHSDQEYIEIYICE